MTVVITALHAYTKTGVGNTCVDTWSLVKLEKGLSRYCEMNETLWSCSLVTQWLLYCMTATARQRQCVSEMWHQGDSNPEQSIGL